MKTLMKSIVIIICVITLAGCAGKKDDDLTSSGYSEDAEKACKVEEEKLEADSTVIAIGDEKVKYKELLVYMYILKDKYQDTFGEEVWNIKVIGNKTLRSVTVTQVIDLITKIKIINREAEGLGVSLTSDETEDIRRYCGSVFEKISDKDKNDFMLDAETITQVYCENEIANKVYDSCISGVNTEINNDETRQCTVQYIFLQTSGINQSGVKVSLSEKNKKKRYREALKLRREALSTDDFYSLAQANTEADKIEIVFGRGDMSEEFTEAAFALKKGSVSNVINSPEGFYIIYCIEENNEELAIQKKEEMIEEEWKENFEKRYASWAREFEVNISKLILD